MEKFTIVYSDGHEEHYQFDTENGHSVSAHLRHFKEMIEDEMLKLIDNGNITLIPLANVRKIVFYAEEKIEMDPREFPGYLHVTPV
ncbi:MAG: hypothetical protein R3302_01175 [Sulfurimonadaceae bacterium]|nr:hypothetical protein [Sulfurimonadaceae bacterium]